MAITSSPGQTNTAQLTPPIRRSIIYTLVARLPWPAWVSAVGLTLLYGGGFLTLLATREPERNPFVSIAERGGIGLPLVAGLALYLAWYLERAIEAMLRDTRPVVRIDDAAYTTLTVEALTVSRTREMVIALLGLLLGPVAWFGSAVSSDPLIQNYVLLGIILVSLTVVLAFDVGHRGLHALHVVREQPLAIDIFDTDDLAPIARLSLRISTSGLTMVGLMLLFFGVNLAPIAPYLYGVLTLLSGISFFLPLLGLHERMTAARAHELETIQTMVRQAYEDLKTATLADRLERAETLSYLLAVESRVLSASTWPYNISMLWQLAVTLLIPVTLTLLQIFAPHIF